METAVSSQPKYRRLGALFSQPQTSQPRDTASGRTGAESGNHAADAHALDVEAAESKDLRALSHALEPAVLHVSSAEWRERFGRDAWDLVLRTILHKCGESCWKYNGNQDTEPGAKETLRKVVHPVANLEDMGSALRVDKSTVAFVEELTSFLKGVEKICRGDRTAALPAESKMHWDKRRQLAAQLLRNTVVRRRPSSVVFRRSS